MFFAHCTTDCAIKGPLIRARQPSPSRLELQVFIRAYLIIYIISRPTSLTVCMLGRCAYRVRVSTNFFFSSSLPKSFLPSSLRRSVSFSLGSSLSVTIIWLPLNV